MPDARLLNYLTIAVIVAVTFVSPTARSIPAPISKTSTIGFSDFPPASFAIIIVIVTIIVVPGITSASAIKATHIFHSFLEIVLYYMCNIDEE